ncbi:MAG: CxxC-x17-CxxC domain-containing protein [Patescibacteria group bacterium]|nr:CxxC-x17-CxxC domain-containing protein [Patescibacteria group bacterium]
MFQGNWTCAKCGAAITELPFEPDGERPLYCRDCHRQMRQNRPRRF